MTTMINSLDVSKYLSGAGQDIPLFKVFMSDEAIQASSEVLRSGYIGQGPRVDLFERALCDWMSSSHVLSVNSGTAALHLALRLADVGHGDEVITTPMTCMATNVPILERGAHIVWADIDPLTGNISPESVEKKITSKTKAVICVDWAGYPCRLNELQEITKTHGIKLIEDAAHAFGAKYQGKCIGGIADFTCFSFQAIKHLTTVDGGALVCKSPHDYKRGKLLRWFGIDREKPRLDFRCEEDVVEHGYKFHMNDVAAAIGLEQLKHMSTVIGAHRAHAQSYRQSFKELAERGLILLQEEPQNVSSYWLFTMRVPDRNQFIAFMKEKGIIASQVHARNDLHTVFKDYKTDLPGVDLFAATQVSIPVGWWLKDEEVDYIQRSVHEYFSR